MIPFVRMPWEAAVGRMMVVVEETGCLVNVQALLTGSAVYKNTAMVS